ncbi:MAG TPA: DUF2271 domain-containing protein [Bacteroidales bacterium]|nr:DUF2271 domain-containing protein [Bacteroidales bacterium]
MKSKRLALLLVCIMAIYATGFAQTAGTLTFTVKTTAPSGQYNPRHLVAIWIQNSSTSGSSASFIKTKIKYGYSYLQFLNAWVSASGQNTTDAVTGATRTNSPETLSFSWNGTNASGVLVPDGTYYIWMQMTAQNMNGATAYISFTKGPSEVTLTPANTGNYSDMSLTWTPSTFGSEENNPEKPLMTITSNPVSGSSMILYTLDEPSDVTLTLHDVTGKLVNVILDGNQNAGAHTLPLTGTSGLKSGIYFVKIYTGKVQHTVRIFVP